MSMSHRENFLRNASLQGHAWIPADVFLVPQLWYELREELEEFRTYWVGR